jgi:hypothetical protein
MDLKEKFLLRASAVLSSDVIKYQYGICKSKLVIIVADSGRG